MFKRLAALALATTLCAPGANGQTIPFTFATQQGNVPASELDANFNYLPTWAKGYFCPLGGCVLTGELTLNPSSAGSAGINFGTGVAPSSPVNGDLWITSAGVFARYGGVTVGPFGIGGGTVNTTGSPSAGALAKFSGATAITNGDLSGDCTTSGTLAVTCTKTGGVGFGYFATGSDASNLTGVVSVNRFNSGTGASNATFLRGDGTWAAPAGALIGIQYLTTGSGATFTPDPGTNSVLIILVGAGGGGSGVASPGSGSVYLGSGGNSGGILQKRLTSGFSGATYSVGVGGAGGLAGPNAGNVGGDTTFTTTSAITYTAKGGSGGVHNGPFGPGFISGIPAYVATTGGDIAWSGNAGTIPLSISLNNNTGGSGGWNVYSTGGWAVALGGTNTSAAGYTADGYGGGGSGAVATGTGAAAAGGSGSGGLIIVWEYR